MAVSIGLREKDNSVVLSCNHDIVPNIVKNGSAGSSPQTPRILWHVLHGSGGSGNDASPGAEPRLPSKSARYNSLNFFSLFEKLALKFAYPSLSHISGKDSLKMFPKLTRSTQYSFPQKILLKGEGRDG